MQTINNQSIIGKQTTNDNDKLAKSSVLKWQTFHFDNFSYFRFRIILGTRKLQADHKVRIFINDAVSYAKLAQI